MVHNSHVNKKQMSWMMGCKELCCSVFSDDDMIGKVVNAIMACTEPKQCSAGLLKNYVVEFHSEFGVTQKSSRFKKAIERAENCGDLT